MSSHPRSPRRLVVVLVALLTTVLIAPAAASAAHVTGPGSWSAANTYRATADLDGRSAPRAAPVARVNHVKAGQWVRITCQVIGQKAYGSKVWAKVNGLYVPDRYLKTFTDGFIPGVPVCGATGPKPTPTGPSRTALEFAVASVTYERVYGSNYRIYKERYRNVGIIWDKNGCSVPVKYVALVNPALGAKAAVYSKVFEKSCDRHDFGYRNYGSASDGMKIDPTDARRASIDRRFLKNMNYQCSRKTKVLEPDCYATARIFYTAVTRFGGKHFR